MREIMKKLQLGLATALLAAALQCATSSVGANPHSAPAVANTVACRVLEAHTSSQLGLTAVVFHHQDEKDRERLGVLLRQHSGSSVEFQTSSGAWHSASVVRLKSCFGRGLLLFSAGTAQLREKEEFLLRFPSN